MSILREETNIFTEEDIQYILNLPEVRNAQTRLDLDLDQEQGRVYFTIQITDTIRAALTSRLGLSLNPGVSRIPMRWIKGDTAPHIDTGASEFDNTYLVYLTDSAGSFAFSTNQGQDDVEYPIQRNTGFVFHEGVLHKTINTGTQPRLLVGPMNELAEPVGFSGLNYYFSESDALSYTNIQLSSGSFTVQTVGPYSTWRIAPGSSYGPADPNINYTVGDTLDSTGGAGYSLYPVTPCLLEGTTVLCSVNGAETYVPIEHLMKGMLVKTYKHGFKAVVALGKGSIHNPTGTDRIENRLYKCSPAAYPALTRDLILTGCHALLEFPLSDKQLADLKSHMGKLYVTDDKYRLMACLDERAEPFVSEEPTEFPVYNVALDNADDGTNYGIYVNGGLLVESCCIRTLLRKSNMILMD